DRQRAASPCRACASAPRGPHRAAVDHAASGQPPGSLVREKLAAMFLHQGLPQPADIVETSSLPMTTALLEQGRMIVALPEVSVASYCSAGILKVLMT